MKLFLIDGNNVIGADKTLSSPTNSRSKIGYKLEKYFHEKKAKVSLYFDGFEKDKLSFKGIVIKYSNSREADSLIRDDISSSKNKKLITVVTSDSALANFAKKCSCTVISSESFLSEANSNKANNEAEIIDSLAKSNREFLELFGG